MTGSNLRLRELIARALPALEAYLERKTFEAYRARLWGAMVRLFEGGPDANFMATFARTIDQQLTEAWNKGAAEVGVDPDEMTNDDINILRSIIANELMFIERIAGEIQADKTNGMTRVQFEARYSARADLWATRYKETQNRAKMVFGSKVKFMWVEGPTSDKCPFCRALDGIVAFGYEWDEARIHPQMPPNPTLTGIKDGEPGCKGWGCQCEFKPTTKRRTRRAFERITQIALRV